AELGRLDAKAIAQVRAEAWPEAATADELHDAMVWVGFVTSEEAAAQPSWNDWLPDLARQRRIARLDIEGRTLWITAERLPQFAALWPAAKPEPAIVAPAGSQGTEGRAEWSREEALIEILR